MNILARIHTTCNIHNIHHKVCYRDPGTSEARGVWCPNDGSDVIPTSSPDVAVARETVAWIDMRCDSSPESHLLKLVFELLFFERGYLSHYVSYTLE